MPNHTVVSHDKWLEARRALKEKERELTHLRDEVSRQRLALPWEKVEKSYTFDTPGGMKSLADLFDGRSQLIVYHFMFGPGWEEGCPNCSYLMDHIDGILPHLSARDITFSAISRAPMDAIGAFKKRMGWKFNWASSNANDFNYDLHVSFKPEQLASGTIKYNYTSMKAPAMEDLPGASCFFKDGADVFHTYSTYSRGLDILVGTYMYLDIAPLGRNEVGYKHSMTWVRHHDKYGPGYTVDATAGYRAPKGSACPHCEGKA